MEKTDIKKLIDNYFRGEISTQEIEKAILVLKDVENTNEIEELMMQQWLVSDKMKMPDKEEFASLLDSIHHKINTRQRKKYISKEEPIKELNHRTFIYYLTRAAAVLFIPLLLSFLWYINENPQKGITEQKIEYNEVATPLASRSHFVLPDSTVVWLNAGSKLRYPFKFTGKTREVSLSGEAYFQVATNKKKPFIVNTKKINITAYGTAFNVMAYSDEEMVTTTLVSGKVKVKDLRNRRQLILKPSYQVSLGEKSKKIKAYKVDTRFYTSWKDGHLIFRNEQLDIVAHKLERWFNCTIYIKDNSLKKYSYTGYIDMETLREVLDLITITTPINYTYNRKTREIWLKKK